MTNLFQPLNLMVNRSAKAFIKRKFNEWYSLQVVKQLDFAKTFEDIEVKLLLSTLKPLHTNWILDLYNYLPSTLRKKIIANLLKGSRNQRCNKNGSSSLESLEPFSSINPLDETIEDNIFYCQTKYPKTEFIPTDYDSYDEDERVFLLKKETSLKFWTMKYCIKTM